MFYAATSFHVSSTTEIDGRRIFFVFCRNLFLVPLRWIVWLESRLRTTPSVLDIFHFVVQTRITSWTDIVSRSREGRNLPPTSKIAKGIFEIAVSSQTKMIFVNFFDAFNTVKPLSFCYELSKPKPPQFNRGRFSDPFHLSNRPAALPFNPRKCAIVFRSLPGRPSGRTGREPANPRLFVQEKKTAEGSLDIWGCSGQGRLWGNLLKTNLIC